MTVDCGLKTVDIRKMKVRIGIVLLTSLVVVGIGSGSLFAQGPYKTHANKVTSSSTSVSMFKSPEDSIKQVQEAERNIEKLRRGPKSQEEYIEIVKALAKKAAVPVLIRVAKEKRAPWSLRTMVLELMTNKDVQDERNWDAMMEIIRDVKDDASVRAYAAGVLANMKIPRSYDTFMWALHDTSAGVRLDAFWGLVGLNDERAVSTLIETLTNEKDPKAAVMIGALGLFRRRDVSDVLVKYLNHPNPSFRLNAIEGLGNQKDPALVKNIKPFLSDQDEVIRMSAIEAIGELGGDEAFHLLVSFLEDKSGFMAMEAAKALSKMGDVRAIEPLKKAKQRWDFQEDSLQRELDNYIRKIEKGEMGK